MESGSSYANAAPPPKKRTSPWVWVGCGCGVLALLGALGIGGLAYTGYRQAKEFQTLQHDPQALAQRIQKIAPYRDLPAGYVPQMVIAVPILTQTAIFGRRRPDGTAGPAPRRGGGDQFIISRTFSFSGGVATEEERRRFLDPRRGVPSWFKGLPIPVPAVETLRTGSFQVGGHTVYYRTQRTEVTSRGTRRSLFTTVGIVDCADPMHVHTVMWNSGAALGAQQSAAEQGAAEQGAAEQDAASQRVRLANRELADRLLELCGAGG